MAAETSPGLARALRATASPRRGSGVAGYERVGARRERRRLYTAGLALLLGLLVLAAFFLWERHNAVGMTYSHWGWLGSAAGNDYDEGAYDNSALLVLKGYPLFGQIFSAQPAFFLLSLAAALRVVGDPVVGGHIYAALCGLLALAGVFWMAWTAYRPLAAPLAAALLAISPGFLLYGHAVESELPMLGLCTLAVAAAQQYYQSRRRSMAALAGLLLMAGTEMKLLSVVVGLPLLMLLLGGAWSGYRAGRSRRAIALDAGAFLFCLLVPALLTLALLSPSAQYREVVTFHLAASHAIPLDAAGNLTQLRQFLGYDPGLFLVAMIGAVLGLLGARRRYLVLVYLLWFVSTLLFLYRYHPLFQHQLVPLLPPLALLGAALLSPWRKEPAAAVGTPATGRWRQVTMDKMVARQGGTSDGRSEGWWRDLTIERLVAREWITEGATPLRRLARRGARVQIASVLAGVAFVAYLAILAPNALTLDRNLFAPYARPDRAPLIALLDRYTRPGDFVACDDPMVCLGARRLPVPGLEDPSYVRTGAGYLTVAEAEAATLRYHVAAVVASRPMFATALPAYLAWVGQHYRQVLSSPGAGPQVYVRR